MVEILFQELSSLLVEWFAPVRTQVGVLERCMGISAAILVRIPEGI
jgi:hypothetical protein